MTIPRLFRSTANGRVSLVLGTALSLSLAVALPAAEFTASTPAELIQAITDANNETLHPGADTITLTATTYTFTGVAATNPNWWFGPNALPAITSTIVIEGQGATLQSTNPTRLRFFFIGADPTNLRTFNFITPGAGSLTLRNLTMTGGKAKGGDSFHGGGGAGLGGAIFNQGILVMDRVTLQGNSALGGSSGMATGSMGDSGGGVGEDAGVSFYDGGPDNGGGFGGTVTVTQAGSGYFFSTRTSAGGQGGVRQNYQGGTGGNGGGYSGARGTGGSDALVGGEAGAFGRGGGRGVDALGGGSGGGGGGIGGGGGGGGHSNFAGGGGGGGGFGGGGGKGGSSQNESGAGGAGGFGGGGGFGSFGGFGGFGGGSGSGGGGGFGGAIFNCGGALTLTGCTLTGNTAQGGTGYYAFNPGGGYGGAICNLDGSVSLSFCTVTGNTVTGAYGLGWTNGGAVYNLGYSAYNSVPITTVTLTTSILAGTSGGDDLCTYSPTTLSASEGFEANANVATVTFVGTNLVQTWTIPEGTVNPPTLGVPGKSIVLTSLANDKTIAGFGETVTLTATVTGATGTVTFQDGATTLNPVGVPLDASSQAVLATSTLAVGSHHLTATYSGDDGHLPSTSEVLVLAVGAIAPGAPTIGSAIAGNAQAVVLFSVPASTGGVPITGYTVTAHSGGVVVTTATGPVSPILVTGLSNGTAYTFTVTATNSAGGGPASAASNSVTPVGASALTLVSDVSATSFGQNVIFTASLGGGATGTVLFLDGSATVGSADINAGTAGLSTTGLAAGSHAITACYLGDAGHAATISNAVTQTVSAVAPGTPGAVVATAGDGQATVTFTAPASDGGAAISGYTATARIDGVATAITKTGTASPLIVTGLSNGTAYTFTVTATNSTGTGPVSAASNSVTPQADIRLTLVSDDTTADFGQTVTFTATPRAGATGTVVLLDGYTPLGGATISNGSVTFTTATLAVGRHAMTAVYAGDTGHAAVTSAILTQTVAATVPGAPTIGTASAGDGQATVAFTAPASDGGAAISGYTATAWVNGVATAITANGTTSPITVTGLSNGFAYTVTVTVTATNSVGTSAASAASNRVTPMAAITAVDTGSNDDDGKRNCGLGSGLVLGSGLFGLMLMARLQRRRRDDHLAR